MTQVTLYDGEVNLEFNENRHIYTWKEKNLPVRGVTSVLKWLNKPALMPWAANMAAAFVKDNFIEGMSGDEMAALCEEARGAHRRMAKSAADIGTEVHSFCEAHLKADMIGGVPPAMLEDETARKSCVAFLNWAREHDIRPIELEHILFSSKHYFAGTCDFYGHIDGELCVLDFKTSSGIYVEMIIQLAAYNLALTEMYGERVEAGWIIRLDKKTGKFETCRIPRSDEDQTAFRVLLEVDTHMKRLNEKMKELRKK